MTAQLDTSGELKPCPFCGGEAGYGFTAKGDYFVNCTDCLAATNRLIERRTSKDEATAAWNVRYSPPNPTP